jgi:hypothetical protein
MRTDDLFMSIWKEVTERADALRLTPPQLPRKRRPPRRMDDGTSSEPHDFPDCVTYHKVNTWYAVLDVSVQQITSRFLQNSFQELVNAESLLLTAAKGQPFEAELEKFCSFYDDFDGDSLRPQLKILGSAIKQADDSGQQLSLGIVAELLKKIPGANVLLRDVWRLMLLLLVMPASAAAAERSFSSLRRVKNYMRNTLGQSKLNSLLLLHCHKERTDLLDLKDIAQKFVLAVDQRALVFGHFD